MYWLNIAKDREFIISIYIDLHSKSLSYPQLIFVEAIEIKECIIKRDNYPESIYNIRKNIFIFDII